MEDNEEKDIKKVSTEKLLKDLEHLEGMVINLENLLENLLKAQKYSLGRFSEKRTYNEVYNASRFIYEARDFIKSELELRNSS